ncbi:uncharacterized protein LOC110629819 isoform X2 [Manihot esculenta]|uniref:uncharacterized protein LOC110629819 isoform X2 n=1 Tax=Manihot esculenta TaxID=3983 RepID=UPI001CC6DCB8|nr:uncharacterized protein LOC110629819 isoform X2 [Manihot esculenta]
MPINQTSSIVTSDSMLSRHCCHCYNYVALLPNLELRVMIFLQCWLTSERETHLFHDLNEVDVNHGGNNVVNPRLDIFMPLRFALWELVDMKRFKLDACMLMWGVARFS